MGTILYWSVKKSRNYHFNWNRSISLKQKLVCMLTMYIFMNDPPRQELLKWLFFWQSLTMVARDFRALECSEINRKSIIHCDHGGTAQLQRKQHRVCEVCAERRGAVVLLSSATSSTLLLISRSIFPPLWPKMLDNEKITHKSTYVSWWSQYNQKLVRIPLMNFGVAFSKIQPS